MPLHRLAELAGHSGIIRKVAWCEQDPSKVISLEEGHIRSWALREGSAAVRSCPSIAAAIPPVTVYANLKLFRGFFLIGFLDRRDNVSATYNSNHGEPYSFREAEMCEKAALLTCALKQEDARCGLKSSFAPVRPDE